MFSTRGTEYGINGVDDGFTLTFDIITEEKHNFRINASEHPVEEGMTITDFTQRTQEKGMFTGMISNFGLKRGELLSNHAQDAFDTLWAYRDNVVPVNIATTLRYYENMIITNVSASRSGKSGEAQSFNISFQKLDIVMLETTTVSKNRVRLPSKAELKAQADSNKKKTKKLKSGEIVRVASSAGYEDYGLLEKKKASKLFKWITINNENFASN